MAGSALSSVQPVLPLQPHSRPIVSYYFPKSVGEHHYGVRRLVPIT